MTSKLDLRDGATTARRVVASLIFVAASATSGLVYCQAKAERGEDKSFLDEEQKAAPNHFHLSRLANNAGMDQLIRGNYAEAERMLQQALSLIRKIPLEPIPSNPPLLTGSDAATYQDAVARVTLEGSIAHNLGQVFFRQKKYSQAEPMYKLSIAAAEADPRKALLKAYLLDLEALYIAMGNEELTRGTRKRIRLTEATR